MKAEILKNLHEMWFYEIQGCQDMLYTRIETIQKKYSRKFELLFEAMNKETHQEPVCYITISEQLTSIWIYGRALYIVRAYSQQLELGSEIYAAEMDFQDIYHNFLEIYHKALKHSRQYAGRITKIDVKEYFMQKLDAINCFIERMVYGAILNIAVMESVKWIWIGDEYSALSFCFSQKPVYARNIWDEDETVFYQTAADRKMKQLSFRIFQSLILNQAQVLRCRQYWLSRFYKCNMRQVSFFASILMQCSLEFCDLSEADFSYSCIQGSVFKNCQLKKSNFSNLKELEKWHGFFVQFFNVDLTGATFENTEMKNMRFYDSILEGCLISAKWRGSTVFQHTQTTGVLWI